MWEILMRVGRWVWVRSGRRGREGGGGGGCGWKKFNIILFLNQN